jgi:tripartite-type tricarboxylate transporter receptor subunit TctC
MLALEIITPFASIAAGYPDRPIQLVIPTPAGGYQDVTSRPFAEEMEKILGTKVISNFKPGASTVVGTDYVVRAKKDGYTLLYAGASGLVYVPASNPGIVHYDPSKDLEPLGHHVLMPQTITVRSDAPWKTFPELIDYAKKNPGKLRVSTIGMASVPHFLLEKLQLITGAQFNHVPFKGGELVMTALLGGHVEITCDVISKVQPFVDAGKMRVLLITHKMSAFPAIPTITEFGFKETLPATWFALYAPVGIPEEVRNILIPAIEKSVNNTKSRLDQIGCIVEYKSPLELRQMAEKEYKEVYETAIRLGLRQP